MSSNQVTMNGMLSLYSRLGLMVSRSTLCMHCHNPLSIKSLACKELNVTFWGCTICLHTNIILILRLQASDNFIIKWTRTFVICGYICVSIWENGSLTFTRMQVKKALEFVGWSNLQRDKSTILYNILEHPYELCYRSFSWIPICS